ncbi:sugar-binding transcriptional regulator [Aureimonas endophytica]|nr:sugar-binding transcriptional regulator [Aureimonas endophytica]
MSDARLLSKPSRLPATPPPQFGDLVAWAAWLYYVDEMTQAEIALRLGVSRASVANYLQEARRAGIVTIRLDPGAVSRTAAAKALAERFGLAEATVVPALEGRRVDTRIGVAGAKVLAALLEEGDTVGVAWGRTILALARAAEPAGIERLTVAQVSGSSASTDDFAPELCTTLLANQLGARCVNLHAPAVLSSRDLRDRLLAEPALQRQFALINSATKIVFGVGDIGPTSTFHRSGMLTEEDLGRIVAEGRAKGVVIGRLIDAAGRPVPSPIDDGIVGISVEELKAVPVRLCLAGGPLKTEAIRGALVGGLATHFVTDSDTAERLLSGS